MASVQPHEAERFYEEDEDPARVPADFDAGQKGDSRGYCDRCGRELATGGGGHDSCRAARKLEPPRYCVRCGRRTVVKVTPDGWSSHCTRHGMVTDAG